MSTATLLDPQFIASLPEEDATGRLDQLTRAVVGRWVDAVAAAGGYDPELAPAITQVPGDLVAQQFTNSWDAAYATLSTLAEPEIQVGCLTMALQTIAQQMIDLAPKRSVLSGSMLMSEQQKADARRKLSGHVEAIIEALTHDGAPPKLAGALVRSSARVSTATLAKLLDVSVPSINQWVAKGAAPDSTKNAGPNGKRWFTVGSVARWLATEVTLDADALAAEPELTEEA